MSELAENLSRVREAIAEAALSAGRAPDSVVLVGAAKTIDAERVAEAISLGLDHIGENFVQEAESKLPKVKAATSSSATWHMIGHLQTNKVKAALDCFDIIETVDSVRLATSVSRRAEGRVVEILLEVYLGEDAGRPGLRPDELEESFSTIVDLPNIRVQGLMTVAPLGLDLQSTRSVFRAVRELRDRLRDAHPNQPLSVLSMGMTDDFPVAIQEGATAVRIGRAIFGARPS